ncbi:MAG: hypothetical protein ACREMV_00355 [Gemmatimonadales bacterium]
MGAGAVTRAAWIVGFACLLAPAVAAQQRPVTRTIDSGVVVRLRFIQGAPETVRLLAPFAPDSAHFTYCPATIMTCRPGADFVRVTTPARDVRRVDIHHPAQTGRGAVAGGIAGAGLGVGLCIRGDGCSADEILVVGVLLGALGMGIGALFGAAAGGWGPAP